MTHEDPVTPMDGVVVGASIPEIVVLEERLRRAQLDADIRELDALISSDLLFVGPDGALYTKAQDIEAHRSGAVRFRAHAPEELRLQRVTDDVVVASLRTRLAVDVGGVPTGGTFRYTRVWARESGAWRIVAGHVSAVAA